MALLFQLAPDLRGGHRLIAEVEDRQRELGSRRSPLNPALAHRSTLPTAWNQVIHLATFVLVEG